MEANFDPSKVKLKTKKSDLVEPFCTWNSAATVIMKTKSQHVIRCWEKTGVMIAWTFGSSERNPFLAESTQLHASGELWKPIVDKKFKNEQRKKMDTRGQDAKQVRSCSATRFALIININAAVQTVDVNLAERTFEIQLSATLD
jgi:hypothetical protein